MFMALTDMQKWYKCKLAMIIEFSEEEAEERQGKDEKDWSEEGEKDLFGWLAITVTEPDPVT